MRKGLRTDGATKIFEGGGSGHLLHSHPEKIGTVPIFRAAFVSSPHCLDSRRFTVGKIPPPCAWQIVPVRTLSFTVMGMRISLSAAGSSLNMAPFDETAMENLARYIIRASFSQERMTYFPGESKVIYESKDGREDVRFSPGPLKKGPQ